MSLTTLKRSAPHGEIFSNRVISRAVKQAADRDPERSRQPHFEELVIIRNDYIFDAHQGVDRLRQAVAATEPLVAAEHAADIQREHRADALLARAAVECVPDILPADPKVSLHKRFMSDRKNLLQTRHLRRNMLHRK